MGNKSPKHETLEKPKQLKPINMKESKNKRLQKYLNVIREQNKNSYKGLQLAFKDSNSDPESSSTRSGGFTKDNVCFY